MGMQKIYSDSDFESAYKKVIEKVENGMGIKRAIKKYAIMNDNTFYKRMNSQQKALLDIAKTSNTIFGVSRFRGDKSRI